MPGTEKTVKSWEVMLMDSDDEYFPSVAFSSMIHGYSIMKRSSFTEFLFQPMIRSGSWASLN